MSLERILTDGEVEGLQEALAEQPSAANDPVGVTSDSRHPIHAICDYVFEGRLLEDVALPMVSALIAHGADVNHRHTKTNDSLLITACSLAAPQVAVALIDAGADIHTKGFGATALHWSAMLGMPLSAASLLQARADCGLLDDEYQSTPLGWAMQGWKSPPKGSKGEQIKCAVLLVKAGSPVDPQWLHSEKIRYEPALFDLLKARCGDSPEK